MVYALVAIGFSMVYGIIRLMNFAHGDIYMVGAFSGLSLLLYLKIPVAAAFLLAILMAVSVTLIMARYAYRPLFNAPRESLFLTTIGSSIILEYGAMLLWGPDTRPFPIKFPMVIFNIGSAEITSTQIIIMAVAAISMLILTTFVQKTRLGMGMRAASQNMNTARLMGVNVDRIVYATFIAGSALAAIAGLLVAVYYNAVYPLMGFQICLIAFASSVLGGIGSIPGAMIGGIVMGLAEALGAAYISSGFRDGYAFIILILCLMLRPSGLLGKAIIEKS
jgi:branched-chain amino acid transport system permease protein